MQSYRDEAKAVPSSTAMNALGAAPAAAGGRPDEMGRYRARYEESMNPFEVFRGRVSIVQLRSCLSGCPLLRRRRHSSRKPSAPCRLSTRSSAARSCLHGISWATGDHAMHSSRTRSVCMCSWCLRCTSVRLRRHRRCRSSHHRQVLADCRRTARILGYNMWVGNMYMAMQNARDIEHESESVMYGMDSPTSQVSVAACVYDRNGEPFRQRLVKVAVPANKVKPESMGRRPRYMDVRLAP